MNPNEEIKDENIINRQSLNTASSLNVLKNQTGTDLPNNTLKGRELIEEHENENLFDNNNNMFQVDPTNNKKASISSSINELENINNQDNDFDNEDPTNKIQRSVSVRPETPPNITHNADFDDDDDEELS